MRSVPIHKFFTACLVIMAVAFVSVQAKAAGDETAAVMSTVSGFYGEYLKSTDKINDLVGYLKKQPDVDKTFVNKVAELAKNSGYEGGLEYDPLVMAQEVPSALEFDQVAIKGATAHILIYTIWGEEQGQQEKRLICVSLKKSTGKWRISNVIDLSDEEKEHDCDGLKAK